MVSAEMIGFTNMDPAYDTIQGISGIQFFTNNTKLDSISNIQRGEYISTGSIYEGSSPQYYEPVPLELYIKFSFLSYFMAFIGILLLQSLTIFITDVYLLKNMPSTVKLWERVLHSIQKSHLPFPIQNWHEGKGSCLDHMKRHKLVQKEVLTATIINLAFNMVMLIPLVILRKIKKYNKSLYSCDLRNKIFQIKGYWKDTIN